MTIGNGVTKIDYSVFAGCDNVKTLVIGNGLTSIDNLPISDTLESITIGNGITEIGEWTFYDYSNLESITIPDSVTSIGDYAFYDCSSLTTVNYKGTQEQWGQISIGSYNGNLINATINYNYTGE